MLTTSRKNILLLMIFTFAFIYRLTLMFLDGYPPGADIGLHNSVIYSITSQGSNVDFFYNNYHMGSGLSLTFPGYHIFTSSIMLMTGITEYLAHSVVVSLFSALIVMSAFLITKFVWSEPAAFVVALLAAISRFDIEMLLWAGYPNIITLFLIPLTFYLFLRKERFSNTPFLAATSILIGSIFLTHSLSSAIFVGIMVLAVFLILVKPKMVGLTRKDGFYLLQPIILGIVLFAPFLVEAVPAYINNNATLANDQASAAIEAATISTRVLPLWLVLPLFGVPIGFLVFSKKRLGHALTLPTLLLTLWVLVPMILTQSYLIHFSIDYNRFLYYAIMPLIIFMGILIEHGSTFFTNRIMKRSQLAGITNKTKIITKRKKVYTGFILFFLLFSFIALPIFMSPIYYGTGQSIQTFYQTMTDQGWKTIDWIKTNTPTDAMFVSDALYGWWLGGFAQRRTYSAVDPQYLSINQEYDKAVFAKTLLDTDYLIDNGLVQVRDDGGYIVRHNPQILATLNWTHTPYTFFNFASNETTISYGNENETITLDKLSVKDMSIESNAKHATIIIARGNEFLNYTQLTTVYRGYRFVNMTSYIESTLPLNRLNMTLQMKGERIEYNNNATIGLIEEPMKALGQLIFNTNQPEELFIDPYYEVNGSKVEGTRRAYLQFNLHKQTLINFQFLASAYSVSDDLNHYVTKEIRDNYLSDYLIENIEKQPFFDNVDFEQIFDYQAEIQKYKTTYIVYRVTELFHRELLPKFLRDPHFNTLLYNNATNGEVISEIVVFKVNRNLRQDG